MVLPFLFIAMAALLRLIAAAPLANLKSASPRSRGVTVPYACADLGISISLGYELIARGEFPCRVIKAGRRIIVPRAELDRVLGRTAEQSESSESA